MLTPPRDSSPEPSRPTDFRIEVNPRNEVGQLLHSLAGASMGDLRLFSYATGQIPFTTKILNIPNKVSLQTWSERQAEDLELVLTAQHVASSDMQPDSTYRIIVLRRVSPRELWDNVSSNFDVLSNRIGALEDRIHELQRQISSSHLSRG